MINAVGAGLVPALGQPQACPERRRRGIAPTSDNQKNYFLTEKTTWQLLNWSYKKMMLIYNPIL